MNSADELVTLRPSNATFRTSSVDLQALDALLVKPIAEAGRKESERVVDMIDGAITTVLIVVLALVAVTAVGVTVLTVVLVRRRRQRRHLEAANEGQELTELSPEASVVGEEVETAAGARRIAGPALVRGERAV